MVAGARRTSDRKVVRRMTDEMEVTDHTVLAQTAQEIIAIFHKHGIRHREVAAVLEHVTQQISSQPINEAKRYPNSR